MPDTPTDIRPGSTPTGLVASGFRLVSWTVLVVALAAGLGSFLAPDRGAAILSAIAVLAAGVHFFFETVPSALLRRSRLHPKAALAATLLLIVLAYRSFGPNAGTSLPPTLSALGTFLLAPMLSGAFAVHGIFIRNPTRPEPEDDTQSPFRVS